MKILSSRLAVFAALCLSICLNATSASAQSLNKKAPAPLQEGVNQASVDSLIGPHYWYFFAEPGRFQLTFSAGGASGLGSSGRATVQAGFSPKTLGAAITVKSSPQEDVFTGSVTTRTRVGVGITPPNSPLVRSTVSYTLTASGNVSMGSDRDVGPPIAGLYSTMYNNPLGAVKFKADGSIEAANGEQGTWKLFDADSDTYTVIIHGQRMSLRLDPGRGLIDVQSGIIPFQKTR